MTPDPQQTAPEQMTVERVERDDGRYLIYYHWPSPAPLSGETRHAAPGNAEPWSPEAGPADE